MLAQVVLHMGGIVFHKAGFTLVEMLIAIVVVSIAMSALMTALSSAVEDSPTPVIEVRALSIAQAYADAIMAMAFDDQTPNGGGAVASASLPCVMSSEGQGRASFDDVDDFNGVKDQPPVLVNQVISQTNLSQFTVEVSVTCAGSQLGLAENYFAKRITITVTLPNGNTRLLSVYKGNY